MVLEGLAARYAAQNATEELVAELREILAGMRSSLDAEDLVGASELNARLHALLVEIAGHRTVSRLVALLNPQLVRFQFRTILVPGRAEQSFLEHPRSSTPSPAATRTPRSRPSATTSPTWSTRCARRSVRPSGAIAVPHPNGAHQSMSEPTVKGRVAIIGIGEAGRGDRRRPGRRRLRRARLRPAGAAGPRRRARRDAGAARGRQRRRAERRRRDGAGAVAGSAAALRPGPGLRRPQLLRRRAQAGRRRRRRADRRRVRRRRADGARAGQRPAHAGARVRAGARRAFAEQLGALGMPVEVLAAEPGQAAERKLLRSVFMKGLAAASIEACAPRGRPAASIGCATRSRACSSRADERCRPARRWKRAPRGAPRGRDARRARAAARARRRAAGDRRRRGLARAARTGGTDDG